MTLGFSVVAHGFSFLYTYLFTFVWDILLADDAFADVYKAHAIRCKSVAAEDENRKIPNTHFCVLIPPWFDSWKTDDVKQSNTCVVCIYVLFHAHAHIHSAEAHSLKTQRLGKCVKYACSVTYETDDDNQLQPVSTR